MVGSAQVVPDVRTVGTLSEVAELYFRSAGDVRRVVAHAVHAREASVEDACQVAWGRLIVHRRHVQRGAAIAWVVRTAVHEACRSLRRDLGLVPLSDLADEEGEYPVVGLTRPLEEVVEQRARLWPLAGLPLRQRKVVWLQALGFSYVEMADQTGSSRRTVERQLLRGRHRLLAAAGEDA